MSAFADRKPRARYPTRPVRLIVGFPAGTSADIVARLMGQWLSEHLGQTFVIENRPGAGRLMDDSGSVSAAADFMTKRLGERRVMLAVVLAGALVTYGVVSLFVAFFVLAPMPQRLFLAG